MPVPTYPTDTTVVAADEQEWSAYALEGLRQFMAGTTSGIWPANVVYTSNSSTTSSLNWGGYMLPQVTIGSSSNMLTLGNVFYQDSGYRPRIVERDPQPGEDWETWHRQVQEREAAARQRADEARVRREVRETRIQVCEERARALLLSCLTEEQRAEFEAAGLFHVTSKDGRRFRVEDRWTANLIEEVERDGRWRDEGLYCVHPSMQTPVADSLLAQKLWIESDLDHLLSLANRHR